MELFCYNVLLFMLIQAFKEDIKMKVCKDILRLVITSGIRSDARLNSVNTFLHQFDLFSNSLSLCDIWIERKIILGLKEQIFSYYSVYLSVHFYGVSLWLKWPCYTMIPIVWSCNEMWDSDFIIRRLQVKWKGDSKDNELESTIYLLLSVHPPAPPIDYLHDNYNLYLRTV